MIFLRMKYENKKREREQAEQGEDQDDFTSGTRKKQSRTKPQRHMKKKASPRARRR
jgi:hypothetical protein